MFPQIGPLEIAVVALIALMVLGPRRLPEAGRSLGRGLREFKESVTSVVDSPEEPGVADSRMDLEKPSVEPLIRRS
jgi:sec-independent protein translocase protein TatA